MEMLPPKTPIARSVSVKLTLSMGMVLGARSRISKTREALLSVRL